MLRQTFPLSLSQSVLVLLCILLSWNYLALASAENAEENDACSLSRGIINNTQVTAGISSKTYLLPPA